MRIALTHTRFSRSGGVEAYLYRLVGCLLARGEEVHYFCSRREPFDHPLLSFHDIPIPAGPQALKVLAFDRRLRRALRGAEVDVVHGFTKTSRQDIYTDGSGCLRDFEEVSLRLRGPLRRLVRGWGPHRHVVARLEGLRYRRGNFRRVIAMSRMARDQIRERYGLDGSEVEVLYNGIDTERFRPDERMRIESRQEMGAGDDLLILFLGNDDRRKGADILLRAMEALRPVGMQARALLAGRVRRDREIRSLARSLGVRADLLGHREDVPRLLAAADILAFPSRFDIFGMAVLEAMAAGLPAVVSRAAGASEIITHGEDGYLVEPEDPEGVGRALIHLADPARREAMGRRARRSAERYSMDRHVDRLLEIYREVAEEKKGSRSTPAAVLR